MYKFIISIMLIGMISFGCKDDEPVKEEKQDKPKAESEYIINVDEEPSPIGGMKAIAQKIVYPPEAKQSGIQGRVFVKAFVDEEGNVVKTEVIKGAHPLLDSVAVKAIQDTKFNPGRVNGEAVKVQVSIPIQFKLE